MSALGRKRTDLTEPGLARSCPVLVDGGLLSSKLSLQAAIDDVQGGLSGERTVVLSVGGSSAFAAPEDLAAFGWLSRGDEAVLLPCSLGGGDCVAPVGGRTSLSEGGGDCLCLPGGGEEVSGAGPSED